MEKSKLNFFKNFSLVIIVSLLIYIVNSEFLQVIDHNSRLKVRFKTYFKPKYLKYFQSKRLMFGKYFY